MTQPDYLCIGHVTRDLLSTGPTIGGTVTYSPRTARVLGRRAAVVTSSELDFDLTDALAGIDLHRISSEKTTTFENVYTPEGRHQVIHSVAAPLGAEHIPEAWRQSEILHLGPLNQEVDPGLIYEVSSEIVGLTPQGWHRGWGADGQIKFVPWPRAAEILPLATAVIVSWEDILDEETWHAYHQYSRLLVITNGAAGSEVHYRGECRHFPPPQVDEVDPTGVGDIFAAAFFIRLHETGGDPWESARFATLVAAPSVTRLGLDGIPTRDSIVAARG